LLTSMEGGQHEQIRRERIAELRLLLDPN
jgi:hypothetical protein